jgi:hypothetical protein
MMPVSDNSLKKRGVQSCRKLWICGNLDLQRRTGILLNFPIYFSIIVCGYCALSPVQRKAMLEKYHRLLKDDGLLPMDVYSLIGFEGRCEVSIYEHMLQHGF